MVRPPYWVAARIYRAAAGSTHRRVSGTYTLNTGLDVDDLPPHLWLNVIESWIVERLANDDLHRWFADLNEPPGFRLADLDVWASVAHLARTRARAFTDAAQRTELVPPGWDEETLLQEAVRGFGADAFSENQVL